MWSLIGHKGPDNINYTIIKIFLNEEQREALGPPHGTNTSCSKGK